MAWPWLYAAHSSTSSRVRPISRAVFSPTVIDMSNAGASGVSGWLGDIHCCGSPPGSSTFHDCGAVLWLWVPPATTTRSMPARMLPAPICTALSPAAQWRLSAMPGTLVSPRRTATLRAMTPPPYSDSATTMSSMSAAPIPERDTASPTAISARRNASTSTSDPLKARPIGVRAAATMTASVMMGSRSRRARRWYRSWRRATGCS